MNNIDSSGDSDNNGGGLAKFDQNEPANLPGVSQGDNNSGNGGGVAKG